MEAKKLEENKPVREEWLTKVPKRGPVAGVTARAFKRSKDTSVFDSSWEDTPNSKRAAVQEKPEFSKADEKKHAANVSTFEKSRGESLLDKHIKERGAGTKSKEDSGGRVPFNRDTDMGYSGKPTSVEEVKKRAGLLSTRFGSKEYL
ncbi:unnamed protein product [Cylicostephanus goldi]|uniref:DUF3752 domain-containing protein n=1 Tax=Cylicostephanus goldi TaxID=71465 RepID=A0A3P6SS96_CYLGO|nr:unnamed protein product [Cylicostephanus goldi]